MGKFVCDLYKEDLFKLKFYNEAVGKFVCDLFKEDLFKLKFYSVKTSS